MVATVSTTPRSPNFSTIALKLESLTCRVCNSSVVKSYTAASSAVMLAGRSPFDMAVMKGGLSPASNACRRVVDHPQFPPHNPAGRQGGRSFCLRGDGALKGLELLGRAAR